MFNITLEEAKSNYSSLTYNGKRLMADLYGRATFAFIAEVSPEGQIRLSGLVKINGKEWDLNSLDQLFEGPPVGFIRGQFLYFIGTDVKYNTLKSLPKQISKNELTELLEDEEIEVVLLGEDYLLKDQKEPSHLILLDPFGVTARLQSKEGEIDLKLTGYKKKNYEWVCPSDQVYDSLSLLNAGGWIIETKEGKEVVPLEKLDLDWETDGQTIKIKGKAYFNGEEVDAEQLTQKTRSNAATTSLPSGKMGLLPPNFKLAKFTSLIFSKTRLGEVLNLIGLKNEDSLKKERNSFISLKEQPPSDSFKGKLRPYQQEGLNWLWFLYQNGYSGLLADDMGLGKTVQTLAFISLLPRDKPILLVMPTTLQFNWLREISTFLPDRKNQIQIISYTKLRIDQDALKEVAWEALFFDEAQAIKNASSQTFKAALTLSSNFRLSLTGTPIENKLSEMVTHFKFLMPDLELNEDPVSLKKSVAPFILRRKKEDVLKELPPLIEETFLVELSEDQKLIYENFLHDLHRKDLEKFDSIQILELILRLRQISCHPLLAGIESEASAKMEAALNDIEILMDEGKKIVVFSQFTSWLKIIKKKLIEKGVKPLYLDGETVDRQAPVDQFQTSSNSEVFLMSLKAGGVGLNLTAADWILLLDPWWNKAVEDQAIARAHRMGRASTVFAKRYVAIGTIEEKIEALKESKKNLADDMLSETNLTKKEWLSLLDE